MNLPTIRLLVDVLADLAGEEPERRLLAADGAWVLLGASPLPEACVPVLIEALTSERAPVRLWAAALLAASRTENPGARKALEVVAATDADSEVQWHATAALHELNAIESREL